MVDSIFVLVMLVWKPVVITLLSFTAIVGVVALALPEQFRKFEGWFNKTIDTSKLQTLLDYQLNFDRVVQSYTRILGAAACLVSIAWLIVLATY